MFRLVLASQSPRRRDLLQEVGYDFTVDPVKVSEIIDENLTPEGAVLAIAREKISAALALSKYSKSKGFLILAADTVVVLDQKVLAKPSSPSQASKFLTDLSGKTHRVMTALCLGESGSGRVAEHVEITKVHFRPLTSEEISAYIQSGEPMDKAGAYAIQGEGKKFVTSIEGSWSNVVGLPLERLEILLRENGWQVGRR